MLPAGVERFASFGEALAAHATDDLFVIGGGDVYTEALSHADRLELTHVDQEVDGDAFFPEVNDADWREAAREGHDGFSFVTYLKKGL